MDTVELRVRMPGNLKDWLAAKAQAEGRSVTMQTVQILKIAMEKENEQTKPRE